MRNVSSNTLFAFVINCACGRAAVAEPPRAVVQQLAMLSATRQRLIQRGRPAVYNQLAGPVAEQQGFINPTLQNQPPGGPIRKSCQASLAAIDKDRKAIDKTIETLIESDPRLSHLFELVTSVPGIGIATATEVVIATNELQTITHPKKMVASAVRLPCWGCSIQLPVG